ncbi:MAG: transposase [Burkholderiaceae bacterium]|nr:transposase [Burkholderiaceae bacterium]
MHIKRKGCKDKPLSEAQQRRNRRIASPRSRVEHVFAGMAQLGGKMLRWLGLALATLQLH